jgi:hypothetical protein
MPVIDVLKIAPAFTFYEAVFSIYPVKVSITLFITMLMKAIAFYQISA